MRIDVVTIFPKMVRGPLEEGIVGRAIARGLLDVRVHDLRDHTSDRHRVVDGPRGEVLIPLVADICVAIDVAARRIVAHLPEGLIDVNARGGGQG